MCGICCRRGRFRSLHAHSLFRNYETTIALLKRATEQPTKHVQYFDETEKVQSRLHKSLRLWSLYADIEESAGTIDACRAVYERIIELRIATPQIIINYALFLEENHFFEDAFRVSRFSAHIFVYARASLQAYEKGIGLFRWPLVYDIWNVYLVKFVQRYVRLKKRSGLNFFKVNFAL